MKLPKSFVSIAGKYGIREEDIVFAAMADFDMEYRFADTIVALCKGKLLIAAYPYREKSHSTEKVIPGKRDSPRKKVIPVNTGSADTADGKSRRTPSWRRNRRCRYMI